MVEYKTMILSRLPGLWSVLVTREAQTELIGPMEHVPATLIPV